MSKMSDDLHMAVLHFVVPGFGDLPQPAQDAIEHVSDCVFDATIGNLWDWWTSP